MSDIKEPVSSLPTVEEKKFEVTIALSEKYWNDELKKYLFSYERNNTVMISDTPKVTITITDLWRITDLLYTGGTNKVSIRAV